MMQSRLVSIKIIFVIRKDIEEDFRERIGNRVEAICKALHVEIAYAFPGLEQRAGRCTDRPVKAVGNRAGRPCGKGLAP